MNSNIKWIIIFLLLCAVSALFWFFLPQLKVKHPTAVIRQGNTVIKTIDLSTVDEPYEFEIADGNGGYNIVRVESGKIAVTDADCPDKICIKRGFIDTGALPIVCLPHKLSITIENADNGIDAVAGEN